MGEFRGVEGSRGEIPSINLGQGTPDARESKILLLKHWENQLLPSAFNCVHHKLFGNTSWRDTYILSCQLCLLKTFSL